MIGLSPSRPGYFQAQPDVLVAEHMVPVTSWARKTVVSRPISGSTAWRHSSASGMSGQACFCAGVSSASNQACQARFEVRYQVVGRRGADLAGEAGGAVADQQLVRQAAHHLARDADRVQVALQRADRAGA